MADLDSIFFILFFIILKQTSIKMTKILQFCLLATSFDLSNLRAGTSTNRSRFKFTCQNGSRSSEGLQKLSYLLCTAIICKLDLDISTSKTGGDCQ